MAIDDIRDELAFFRDLGYSHLDLGDAPASRATRTSVQREVRPVDRISNVRDEPPMRSARPDDADEMQKVRDSQTLGAPKTGEIIACETLDRLALLAAPCTRCRLAGSRTQVVFGTGRHDAELMFVGEAPGRDEDLEGKPFVGRAGQLLTDIIKAMKLSREEVYIANVIKCRPPENRNPEPDELESCRPYIRRQVELIRPRVIVTLGRFALQSLTGKTYSIGTVRGSWMDLDGARVMPTWHPAYLLRTPSAKKEVWQDMKKVMAELGIAF